MMSLRCLIWKYFPDILKLVSCICENLRIFCLNPHILIHHTLFSLYPLSAISSEKHKYFALTAHILSDLYGSRQV